MVDFPASYVSLQEGNFVCPATGGNQAVIFPHPTSNSQDVDRTTPRLLCRALLAPEHEAQKALDFWVEKSAATYPP